jgi:hypothetical protein
MKRILRVSFEREQEVLCAYAETLFLTFRIGYIIPQEVKSIGSEEFLTTERTRILTLRSSAVPTYSLKQELVLLEVRWCQSGLWPTSMFLFGNNFAPIKFEMEVIEAL